MHFSDEILVVVYDKEVKDYLPALRRSLTKLDLFHQVLDLSTRPSRVISHLGEIFDN
jgi:hypothetical protein